MKKILLILVLCFIGQNAFSQTAPMYSKEYVSGQTEEFKTYFSISEPTRLQVMRILYETNEYLKEINAQTDLEETQKVEKRTATRNQMEQKLLLFLIVEQQQDFAKFKKQSVYFQY